MQQNSLTPENKKRLDDANWKEIYLRLVNYVQTMGKSLKWRTGNRCDFAQGMTAEDLVQEAIKKLYTGERDWNHEKDPDLEKFLRDSVLKSMMSNLVGSKDNTIVQIIPENNDQSWEESIEVAHDADGHASDLVKRPRNPEEIALEKEKEGEARKILDRLTCLAKDDKEVTLILEYTMEGITKPRFLAEKTGLSVEQVYNAEKRLRRLLKKIREESKGGVGHER